MRVLLLGGTTEASLLARALAGSGIDGVFSYAGRTDAPLPQPMLLRIGGFGGVAGLTGWLRAEAITHIVDATHPFAAAISTNALAAAAACALPLIALRLSVYIDAATSYRFTPAWPTISSNALPRPVGTSCQLEFEHIVNLSCIAWSAWPCSRATCRPT